MGAVRIGTRGSPLALWQANHVAGLLRGLEAGLQAEIVTIRTLAEKFPEKEVAEIGSGIFTREIDEALLEGRIDMAVHSLKDVPSEIDARLAVSAERGFLRTLRGGCLVPAGALATPGPEGKLRLVGVIAAPDGSACYRDVVEDDCADCLAAEALGVALAQDLLGRGGAEVIRALAAGDRG